MKKVIHHTFDLGGRIDFMTKEKKFIYVFKFIKNYSHFGHVVGRWVVRHRNEGLALIDFSS